MCDVMPVWSIKLHTGRYRNLYAQTRAQAVQEFLMAGYDIEEEDVVPGERHASVGNESPEAF